MIRRYIVIAAFLAILVEILARNSTPVIKTNKGPVQGVILFTLWNRPYYSFKGIPYAEPPVRKLRYKPPVEIKPWTKTLRAVKEGSVCPQIDSYTNVITGNEDCLYLNVYVPQDKGGSHLPTIKPVMVFIYGGSFTNGYGNSSVYGPDLLLEEGVIVVTFNYRLGALGFLSLDHKDALGNAGLKDQHLALKWVHDNIANFGGDPQKVTLFGQSAGGASVDFQVLSQKSRGLFRNSITMSASALASWAFDSPAAAHQQAFGLGTLLGSSTNDTNKLLQTLRSVSAYDIVRATDSIGGVGPPFKPTLENSKLANKEDTFITKCSMAKYKAGEFIKQPHMMGFVKDESLSFLGPLVEYQTVFNRALNVINSIVKLTSNENTQLSSILTSVTNILELLSNHLVSYLMKGFTDQYFTSKIDLKQRILSKKNDHAVFYYELTYTSKYADHRVVYGIDVDGVGHGDDVGYIFRSKFKNLPVDITDPYNVFCRKLVRLWTNFAKFGNPTPKGTGDTSLDITWPDSRQADQRLIIDTQLYLSIPNSNFQSDLEELDADFDDYTTCD